VSEVRVKGGTHPIKRHLNQKTGECFPSYQTIAKKLHIDRGTVIRYVKKLKAFNLLDPQLRFKEDGSPTSNQYNFDKGSCSKQPPVVAADNPLGCTEPPEQSEPIKKQRTMTDVNFFSTHKEPLGHTTKQRNCPHPMSEVVFLADNVTICHHCYGLLDENLKLVSEDKLVENVCAA
jgi:Helix-turn-helix domain